MTCLNCVVQCIIGSQRDNNHFREILFCFGPILKINYCKLAHEIQHDLTSRFASPLVSRTAQQRIYIILIRFGKMSNFCCSDREFVDFAKTFLAFHAPQFMSLMLTPFSQLNKIETNFIASRALNSTILRAAQTMLNVRKSGHRFSVSVVAARKHEFVCIDSLIRTKRTAKIANFPKTII